MSYVNVRAGSGRIQVARPMVNCWTGRARYYREGKMAAAWNATTMTTSDVSSSGISSKDDRFAEDSRRKRFDKTLSRKRDL